jgi:uncharacterized protein (DUF2141 family)
MKSKILNTLILITLFLNPLFSQSTAPPDNKATLEIRFTGIRSPKGQIAIGINTSSDGWPRNPQMDANWKKVNMEDGVFTAKLDNLVQGTYAISVLDDENSNLEMDMFLGIPKEGWGFSNNPPFKLSAPKFDECSFSIDRPNQVITINMRYAGKGK